MGFFNDLIGSFTGSKARKELDAANMQATNALAQGRSEAIGSTQRGYDMASSALQPYTSRGNAASDMYANALGINGHPAQRQFAANFQGWNPYADAEADMASRSIARRAAAQGFGGSDGVTQLALARAGMERGGQNWRDYLGALQGQAGQGAQMAGAQAGLASAYGNSLANIQAGFGQQQASNAINFGNAKAQNSNVFANNLMGLAGLGVSAYTGMRRPQV